MVKCIKIDIDDIYSLLSPSEKIDFIEAHIYDIRNDALADEVKSRRLWPPDVCEDDLLDTWAIGEGYLTGE